MIFRRSTSALFSMHVFFRVDVVVYCEGGPSLSYSDATLTLEGDSTLDTLYWRSIVATYGFSKTYHFKSVGGKDTINAIAEEVSSLELDSITVCRDADYDRILGVPVASGRIAWSRGYSWENDVIQLPVLESLATALVGNGPDGTAIVEELRLKFSQLEKDLLPWTEIDVSLCARGRGCLFDRDKPLAAIDMSSPPSLRVSGLSARLFALGYRRRPRRVVSIVVTDVTVICYGRLLSKAIYHAFANLLNRITSMRIGYELFMRLAISEMVRAMREGVLPSFATHVQSQRAAFV